jgi:hypothetical protein
VYLCTNHIDILGASVSDHIQPAINGRRVFQVSFRAGIFSSISMTCRKVSSRTLYYRYYWVLRGTRNVRTANNTQYTHCITLIEWTVLRFVYVLYNNIVIIHYPAGIVWKTSNGVSSRAYENNFKHSMDGTDGSNINIIAYMNGCVPSRSL